MLVPFQASSVSSFTTFQDREEAWLVNREITNVTDIKGNPRSTLTNKAYYMVPPSLSRFTNQSNIIQRLFSHMFPLKMLFFTRNSSIFSVQYPSSDVISERTFSVQKKKYDKSLLWFLRTTFWFLKCSFIMFTNLSGRWKRPNWPVPTPARSDERWRATLQTDRAWEHGAFQRCCCRNVLTVVIKNWKVKDQKSGDRTVKKEHNVWRFRSFGMFWFWLTFMI